MKSTLDQLTASEREGLANLYNTPGYKALCKVHELELIGLGKDALDAANMEEKSYLKGRAAQSKLTIMLIREEYKKLEKKS